MTYSDIDIFTVIFFEMVLLIIQNCSQTRRIGDFHARGTISERQKLNGDQFSSKCNGRQGRFCSPDKSSTTCNRPLDHIGVDRAEAG